MNISKKYHPESQSGILSSHTIFLKVAPLYQYICQNLTSSPNETK